MKDVQENKLSMEASHENVKLKNKVTEELNQKQDLLHINIKENSKKDESKKVANAQQDQGVVAGEVLE